MLYEEAKRLKRIVEPQGFTLDLIGPKDREAIRSLLEEVERLHQLIESRERTSERVGDDLSDLRCGLRRLAARAGLDDSERDDSETLSALDAVLASKTGD